MGVPNRVMLSGAWNPGAGDSRITGGGSPPPTAFQSYNTRVDYLRSRGDGFRKLGKLHSTPRAANYFFLDLSQWKLTEQTQACIDNFGYKKTVAAVKLAYKKVAPGLRRTLKVYLPQKAPPKRIRGVPAPWSRYPVSHPNHHKYFRRGGELKKSIVIKQAKGKWPFIPYLMIKVQSYPWFFLRKRTEMRYTGRRGGPKRKRGYIPERIRLSGWANYAFAMASNAIYLSLTKYGGLGNPWIIKPNPPTIPDIHEVDPEA